MDTALPRRERRGKLPRLGSRDSHRHKSYPAKRRGLLGQIRRHTESIHQPQHGPADLAESLRKFDRDPLSGPHISPELERTLLAKLDPAQLGLAFQPVRDQALAAARQSMDFGQLFIGFSFFLIAAALLLMAMLFVLISNNAQRKPGSCSRSAGGRRR